MNFREVPMDRQWLQNSKAEMKEKLYKEIQFVELTNGKKLQWAGNMDKARKV